MTFPKRSHSHCLETSSDAIFRTVLPPQWICRTLGERDYGVDYLIEMVGDSNRLTGHIAAVQLKAMGSVQWQGRGRQDVIDWFHSRPIKKKTVNYWIGLQLPVFLCVVETSTKKVFFVSVKQAIRTHYALFLKNGTFRFRLFRLYDLASQIGQAAFTQEYYRERGYDRFIQRIMDVVAHQEQYLRLFRLAANPLSTLTTSPKDWVLAGNLVQTCLMILEHTGNLGEKDRINQHMCSLPKVSVRSKSKLTREVFASMLRELYSAYGLCLKAAKNYVTKQEAEYWKENDLQFYKICFSLVKLNLPRMKFKFP